MKLLTYKLIFMGIIDTFVPGLYAIKYTGQELDELERLLDCWEDIEFLELFFEQNKADLSFFKIGVEEAIRITRKEAKELRNTLKDAEEGWLNKFKPLNNTDYKIIKLSKQKSKRYWLRFYAIKIDQKIFLITGGAIKLTHLMEDRPHTKEELQKLTKCRDYLIENGVFDEDSFIDFLEF
jgi:hypothetical protein